MVAITDGKDHGRSLQALILFPDILGVFGQPRIECLGFLPGNEPARDMTAALHEVEVVELPERLLVRGNRLDQNLFVVVAEHQNMRQLNGRIPADTHARRNPLDNRTLRRPNGGNGTGGIVVCVQIYHADQSFAHRTVFQRALHIDKGVLQGLKDAVFQILLHGFVDQLRMCRLLRRAKLRLRKNQVDGRRHTFCVFAHALPIRRVGGKLVTGDDCPFFHGLYLRKQNISRQKCVHATTAFQNSFVICGNAAFLL